MPSVSKNALVPYSAEQMFALVNDVESYDQFLPGCKKSMILDQSDSHMRAKMVVSKGGIEKELVTLNRLESGRAIHMSLDDGPFKSLSGGWQFTPLSDAACRVELLLKFKFKNKLVDMAFGKIFTSLTNNMVKAFTERAKKVYG